MKQISLSIKQTEAYKALESVKPTINDTAVNHVLYGGAAGGGKSFLICVWQIIRRVNYPGTRGFIARNTQKSIKESILNTFFEVAKLMNVNVKVNMQMLHATFDNGSKIYFLDVEYKPSDPDFNRLGSTEFTDGAIEESQTISKKAYIILGSRIRYKNDELSISRALLLTGNPANVWIKTDFVEKKELPKYMKFIPALVTDNPNKEFVKGYTAQLKGLPEYDKQRLLYGNWNVEERTGNEFYPNFMPELSTIDAEYDDTLPLHISFDFNSLPYNTCIVAQYQNNSLLIIDELLAKPPHSNTTDTAKLFKKKYGDHKANVFIYGDPSGKNRSTRTAEGKNDFDIIKGILKGMPMIDKVQRKAPPVAVRARFIELLLGSKLLINKKCHNTISDFSNLQTDLDGTKLKKRTFDADIKASYEKYGHITDAIEYMTCVFYSNEYATFANKGKQGFTQIKRNEKTGYSKLFV